MDEILFLFIKIHCSFLAIFSWSNSKHTCIIQGLIHMNSPVNFRTRNQFPLRYLSPACYTLISTHAVHWIIKRAMALLYSFAKVSLKGNVASNIETGTIIILKYLHVHYSDTWNLITKCCYRQAEMDTQKLEDQWDYRISKQCVLI